MSLLAYIRRFFQDRWFRFIIVPVTLFFASSWYSGWQYLFQLLVDEGAMSWLCDECNPDHTGWQADSSSCISTDGGPICKAQDNELQNLYTVMTSSEFAGNFIAGLLYDMVGYKISLVIGYSLHLFGIFSVTQSSRQIQLYWPGAVAAGLAVNIVSFPGYFVKAYFPGREVTLLTINSAAQWATSAIMYLIYEGVQAGGLSFRTAICTFVACGVPFVAAYYLCLPKDRAELNNQLLDKGYAVHEQPEKVKFKDILKPFKHWDIPVFAWLIYTPLVMASNAYLTTLASIAGREVSLTIGNVQAYEFLITLLYAVIALSFGSYRWVLWIVFFYVAFTIAFGLIALVTAPDNSTFQIAAGVVFISGNAFLYATKYIFSQVVVDDMLFGSVAGIIGTSSGLIDLTNVLWRSLAVDHLDIYVSVYFGVVVVSAGMLILLVIRISRGKLNDLKFIITRKELINADDGEDVTLLTSTDIATTSADDCSDTSYYYYDSSMNEEVVSS